MSDNVIESIQQFMQISGSSDQDLALNLLEATNYSIDEALNLYWSSCQNSSTNISSVQPQHHHHHHHNRYHHQSSKSRSSDRNDVYDEEGVRLNKDEVKRQRLIEDPLESVNGGILLQNVPLNSISSKSIFGASSSRHNPKSDKEKSLNKLFAPPHDIMLHENFVSAREVAKHEKKWLLINILDHTDFNCHIMNRYVL